MNLLDKHISDGKTQNEKDKSEHSRFDGGHIAIALLGIGLLIFNGYRVADFLSDTIPTQFSLMALVALLGITVGAFAWGCLWMFSASNVTQDRISSWMFGIDLLGEFIIASGDAVYRFYQTRLNDNTTFVLILVSALLISGNAFAVFLYHFKSDHVILSRQKRRDEAEIRKRAQKAENELHKRELDTRYTKSFVETGEATIALRENLERRQRELDRREREMELRSKIEPRTQTKPEIETTGDVQPQRAYASDAPKSELETTGGTNGKNPKN